MGSAVRPPAADRIGQLRARLPPRFPAPTVPASTALPLALVRSAAFPCSSTMYKLAAAKTRLPLTVRAPTELPGESVPPARMVVGPTVPLPPSVPLKLTNTGEDAIEPLTPKVPALTKVGPL